MSVIKSFVDGWLGTALPSLFLLFLGVLLVLLVVTALWDRRIRSFGAFLGVFIGLLMTSIALENSISGFIGSLDTLFRVRLLAIISSFSLLLLTLIAWVKTALQKQYALVWAAVALLVLLTALFPGLLYTFPSLLGSNYGLAIVTLLIFFLLLQVFHFTVAISKIRFEQRQLTERIISLEKSNQSITGQEEKTDVRELAEDVATDTATTQTSIENSILRTVAWRPMHGTSLVAPVIIILTACFVFATGLFAPQVMIGDEVTHYYMMTEQADTLPVPNFYAKIPTGWGKTEIRRYPHSFLWHYFGAIVYRLSGGSFAVIQLYQALFLVQFLTFAYLLARDRGGVENRSAMLYLLLLASIPLTLIFSVAFYQDIPMAAQVIASFYFLRKHRWFLATLFMCLAIGLKVTAILFFPSFFICLFVWELRSRGWYRSTAILVLSSIIIGGTTFGLGQAVRHYANTTFYPTEKLNQLIKVVSYKLNLKSSTKTSYKQSDRRSRKYSDNSKKVRTESEGKIIANHPGDLRIKVNYFIYGGLVLWLVLFAWVVAVVVQRLGLYRRVMPSESSTWLLFVGCSYIIGVAFLLKSSPDARFFLPGLPFVLLPVAEKVICLPRPRWIIAFIAALSIMQSGYVLAKTYHLRRVSPEIKEAIAYIAEHQTVPRVIFMYPEGNYRLFPVPHEWYMRYHLRDFWRADNDIRIAMLHKYEIGAVVVKKHLISSVDKDITNLGIYPRSFVRDISRDPRFQKVFENSGVAIYLTPPLSVESK